MQMYTEWDRIVSVAPTQSHTFRPTQTKHVFQFSVALLVTNQWNHSALCIVRVLNTDSMLSHKLSETMQMISSSFFQSFFLSYFFFYFSSSLLLWSSYFGHEQNMAGQINKIVQIQLWQLVSAVNGSTFNNFPNAEMRAYKITFMQNEIRTERTINYKSIINPVDVRLLRMDRWSVERWKKKRRIIIRRRNGNVTRSRFNKCVNTFFEFWLFGIISCNHVCGHR